MTQRWSKTFACVFLVALTTVGFAQKVKVGYDKSMDFSKYKTYTWAPLGVPITRPLLYQTIVNTIDGELESKGEAGQGNCLYAGAGIDAVCEVDDMFIPPFLAGILAFPWPSHRDSGKPL